MYQTSIPGRGLAEIIRTEDRRAIASTAENQMPPLLSARLLVSTIPAAATATAVSVRNLDALRSHPSPYLPVR